ncbi:MAG: hypothetical protein R3232_10370 [Clostridia bacterium]|nr:hypothetical protein [Clostridia bacterium]
MAMSILNSNLDAEIISVANLIEKQENLRDDTLFAETKEWNR